MSINPTEIKNSIVSIIDDDEAVRDSLEILLTSVGIQSKTYESAQNFLKQYDPNQPGCLVVDIRMPGMSGLDLQQQLQKMRSPHPLIFVTGHGDVPMAVQAMQDGAFDFIQKPFRDQDLLDRINEALESDLKNRDQRLQEQSIRNRLESLTPREREIIELVAEGKANKVIAAELNLSQRTVELHRAHAMDKMGAKSVAEVVRMIVSSGHNSGT